MFHITSPGGSHVEENQCGIGTGTLILSFITGLAAGIAAALLIDSSKERKSSSDEQDDQLFI
jgi:tetrahydromethanopterin S-methyltransferase subunit D